MARIGPQRRVGGGSLLNWNEWFFSYINELTNNLFLNVLIVACVWFPDFSPSLLGEGEIPCSIQGTEL